MQFPTILLILGLSLCLAGKGSQDIACKKGKLSRKILVGEGDSYGFYTQHPELNTYAPKTKCFVTYKKKASCPEMRFSCSYFNINNKRKNCKGMDRMQIQANGNKKAFCKRTGPDVKTTGKTLKVFFLSDKRKQSRGAFCRLECSPPVETTSRAPVPAPAPVPLPAPAPSTCEDYPEEHTMSLYAGPSDTCAATSIFSGFNEDGIEVVIATHNELRQRVASGSETNGDQPAASNMRKVTWNTELAATAQRWADQCTFGHDGERSKCDGTYVGQNAFSSWNSQESTLDEVMDNSRNAVQSWYDEVASPGFSIGDISPFVFSYGAGHYTQVVWAESAEVGCGLTYYADGDWYATLVICNYAVGGNMQGGNMYSLGPGCGNCPSGTSCDQEYPALCS